jgi:predicted DNA-binding mobile mystery protein A
MRSKDRALARKHLDNKLDSTRRSSDILRPPKGWVKAIREALGMSAKQLATRIGVTKPRIYEIEKAEVSGSITLNSLERAAHALECNLVYTLIPRLPLQETVEMRALEIAKKRIRTASHTMALEDQALNEKQLLEKIGTLARYLSDPGGPVFWEEK